MPKLAFFGLKGVLFVKVLEAKYKKNTCPSERSYWKLYFGFMKICSYIYIMENKSILNDELVEKLERIAFILKTVAHPMRLAIVHLLEQHPRLSVSEICEMLGTEQSLTSHNLQNMRLKGILSAKREGRSVLYSLKEKDVSMIIECLENCQCNM